MFQNLNQKAGTHCRSESRSAQDPRNLLCRHHHLILAFLAFLAFLLGFLSDLFGKFLLYGIAAFAHVLTRSSWQFLSLNRDHHSHEADFHVDNVEPAASCLNSLVLL